VVGSVEACGATDGVDAVGASPLAPAGTLAGAEEAGEEAAAVLVGAEEAATELTGSGDPAAGAAAGTAATGVSCT
jgi:hypothetical protein